MLTTPTIEGLHALKLPAMAAGLAEQQSSAHYNGLSFEERLGLLVDKELTDRESRRLERYLKAAKLRTNAVIEDLDFRRSRGLEKAEILGLSECAFVRNHHNVAILGPTGVGKTFLACALANAAVRHGHSALYLRASRMLDELAIARLDGRFARLTAAWARIDVLVIDDFLLRPLTPSQAADVLEVIEDRAGLRSTIITSQLPIAHWHEAMGEPTVADAVADRVLANLHRIELEGESMRRSGTTGGRGADKDRHGEGPSTATDK
ncbi:MAG: IS21-like element helper ATPase IstB [Actinomycetota bacterium]|nr:IS21-like element helper ATPase IstB [Actinomycetota bacterium]